jgi:cyclopropane fatty-acyl-phospholipid synthase-like methyltransferase
MTAEILGRMADRYRIDAVEAILATEREALGSDFGANGYTTRAQADEFVDVLSLEPDRVLLDLGSGCGWPGVYLAVRSGCHLVSVDPIEAGVQRAATRAAAEGLAVRSLPLLADGEHLPLASGTVDALVHADVMC